MTNVGTIILLVGCVGVGFVLEPLLMSLREGREASTAEAEEEKKPERKPEPSRPAPAPSVNLDLSLVMPEDFPEKVILKETIHITEVNSGAGLELRQGTEVKPVRLEGNNLVFETIGVPLESMIHVDRTNFKELVIPILMKRLQSGGGTK